MTLWIVNFKYWPNVNSVCCKCSYSSAEVLAHACWVLFAPFRLNFSVDGQNSVFTCPVFDITERPGTHFCWQLNFSGQVNPKSYPVWQLKCAVAINLKSAYL